MNEIVPVKTIVIEGGEKLTCNARDLHAFLEVGRDFSNWIKDRIAKYGFMEGVDFITLAKSGEQVSESWGGQNKIDYALALDMAKELAMVENNERGRQVRRYFIECEHRARQVSASKGLSLRQQCEILLKQAEEMERLEAAQTEQTKRIEQAAAIASAALAKTESNFGKYTVLGYARIQNMRLDIQEAAKHGRRLTEICRDLGIVIEQVRDPRFGLVNTYPEEVLADYFSTASAIATCERQHHVGAIWKDISLYDSIPKSQSSETPRAFAKAIMRSGSVGNWPASISEIRC